MHTLCASPADPPMHFCFKISDFSSCSFKATDQPFEPFSTAGKSLLSCHQVDDQVGLVPEALSSLLKLPLSGDTVYFQLTQMY